MRGLTRAGKRASEMAFNAGGGTINWFPGHMAAASRAIRDRLKLADLVIEVRDARIPLSSANEDLQPVFAAKRRILALNKKDLANPNIMNMWLDHFESCKQDCIALNAHSSNSINQLLGLVELKLREAILKEPTLLVMVVGVPNVGKSALINSIHRIANSRFPVNDKIKRARVGPLPGVTQDIAGYKIASQPSIYVLDTPGVLVPSIPDMETGLKLALTGAVKDSVVGEERIAKYLLSLLNIRKTPLHWERLLHRRGEFDEEPDDSCEKGSRGSLQRRRRFNNSDALYVQDLVIEVQRTLCSTAMEFTGNISEDNELESLIDSQLVALRKVFRIPHKPLDESHGPASKKLLTLFRSGKLGPFILDDLTDQHHRRSLVFWQAPPLMQVTENWKERLQAVSGDSSPEMDILRVRKCIQIALRCVDTDRKNRPTIQDIVRELEELEADIRKIMLERSAQSQDLVVQGSCDTNILWVDPTMELRFVFEPRKEALCCLQLTNKTNGIIAFNIKINQDKYSVQPSQGTMRPCSRRYVVVTLSAQAAAPPYMRCDDMLLVQSTGVSQDHVVDYQELFENAMANKVVDEVKLPIVYVTLDQ